MKYRASVDSALFGFCSSSLTSRLLMAARFRSQRYACAIADRRLLMSMSALEDAVQKFEFQQWVVAVVARTPFEKSNPSFRGADRSHQTEADQGRVDQSAEFLACLIYKQPPAPVFIA